MEEEKKKKRKRSAASLEPYRVEGLCHVVGHEVVVELCNVHEALERSNLHLVLAQRRVADSLGGSVRVCWREPRARTGVSCTLRPVLHFASGLTCMMALRSVGFSKFCLQNSSEPSSARMAAFFTSSLGSLEMSCGAGLGR